MTAHRAVATGSPGIASEGDRDAKIKAIINATVVIWLLQAFGVLGSLRDLRIR